MKKAIVAIAVAAFASIASARIENGPHDLSTRANVTPGFSSCQFCHAPHFANANGGYAAIPLWNRITPDTTGYVYRTVAPSLGSGSYTCLSCHDGVADMGQTYAGSNGFTTAGGTPIGAASYANVGSVQTVPGAPIGAGTRVFTAGVTNLTDDHPVGVEFVPGTGAANDVMKTQANAEGLGIKFYQYAVGGALYVECGSCHEPHMQGDAVRGGASLLRATTGLCAGCHAK